MTYNIELVKQDEQQTTTWSGGTTTQLAIYPHDADYQSRNFTWRLSSAKVAAEQSTFTHLPGISRVIMTLDGNLKLEHQGHHSVMLQPFEQDQFEGEWLTNSFGRVTDFNLMMSGKCNGSLTAISLKEGESAQISDLGTKQGQVTIAFYCVDGPIQFTVDDDKTYKLQECDLLLVHQADQTDKIPFTMHNLGDKTAHVVRADMQY